MRAIRRWGVSAVLLVCMPLLSACIGQSTAPVYRIGLVAPFEGRYREIGYDMIYAARLALQEALAANTMDGYRVELVAYDDAGDPAQAVLQAQALIVDPAVIAAIGHGRAETTLAAMPVYQDASLPLVTFEGEAGEYSSGEGIFVLDAPPGERQSVLDTHLREHDGLSSEGLFVTQAAWPLDLPDGAAFRERLLASSLYVPEPGPLSPLTYDAVQLLLDAVARAHTAGEITRSEVNAALGETNFAGLSGPIAFDAEGYWIEPLLYLYREENEDIPTLVERLR